MVESMLSKCFANPQGLPSVMSKASQLAGSNLEKLTALQMNALQSYMDLGLEQVKSVTQIADLKDPQALYKLKTEAVNTVQQRMMADVKALSDWGNDCKAEWDSLVKDLIANSGIKAAA